MARSLRNPDALTGRLYLPNGDMHQIPYDPSSTDVRMMRLALGEARKAKSEGNYPVGAAMVTPGEGKRETILKAHSTETATKNLLNHAEVNLYQLAQPLLGRHLNPAMLYVTLEPCQMCSHLLAQGEIGTIIMAATREDARETFRPKDLTLDDFLRDSGRQMLVVSGLLREEALEIIQPAA
jgi:tRNA(adenine34) deaminase